MIYTSRETAQNREAEVGQRLDRIERLRQHDGIKVEKFLYCREELKIENKQEREDKEHV